MPIRWEMRTPVLSTTHMRDEFSLDGLSTQVAEYEYGYFVYIGSPDTPVDLPDWLQNIAEWAWREYPEDCTWLRFDRDGDDIDELPEWEW